MHRQPGLSSRRIISIETDWDVVEGIMINSEGTLPQALFIFSGAARDEPEGSRAQVGGDAVSNTNEKHLFH